MFNFSHLKPWRGVEQKLISQEGRAGSQHHLMTFEYLVVAGHDGDVAEMLAGPERVHVLQGGVAVPR